MQGLINFFNENDLDGLFLVNDANIRYVSNFTGSDSTVLLLRDKKYFITDYRYSEQAENECTDFEVINVNRETDTHENAVARLVQKHGVKRIGFEKKHLSYDLYEKLSQLLCDTRLCDAQEVVEKLRMIKTDTEIEHIKKASRISDRAFDKFLGRLGTGMTEKEAALELETIIRKDKAEGIAFDIIMVSGQNTSKPHGIPSDKQIEKGDFVTIDFGALYHGYRTDMTRTVVMGKPDDKQMKIYSIVKEAQAVGVDAVKSGVTGAQVNQKVKDLLKHHDYLKFSGEGIGHGLGLDIHETPYINAGCKTPFAANIVITIEPGIYIPFWGGVRIEDTVVVKENGCEVLTTFPRELISL